MKSAVPIRPIIAVAVLAAGLSLAACQDDAPAATPSASSEAVAAPSALPAELTAEQKLQEANVRTNLEQRAMMQLLKFEPPSGSLPAAVYVRGLPEPKLEAENAFRDLFQAVSFALPKTSFQIRGESGSTVLETDAVHPGSFRLAKINGQADFFQQESIRQYKYIAPAAAPAPNALLQSLIGSGWSTDAAKQALGAPDSYFHSRDIYFKSGIEVEERQNVFSVLFRKSYASPVIGSIGPSSKKEEIVQQLGQPQFESSGPDPVFGYKLAPFYIFFSGASAPYDITVYRRVTGDGSNGRPDLASILADMRKAGNPEPEKFIDKLKEIWPDYDAYNNARGGYSINYYGLGLRADIFLLDDSPSYIEIYGNYEGPLTDSISLPRDQAAVSAGSESLAPFRFRLHEDSIFRQELRRLKDERSFAERAASEGKASPDGGWKVLPAADTTFEQFSLSLIRPAGDQPNRDIHIGNFIGSLIWLNDRYFIFDQYFLGIVGYDIKLNKIIHVKVDPEPSDSYRLTEVKDGKIIYDTGNALEEMAYSFDSNGNLVLK